MLNRIVNSGSRLAPQASTGGGEPGAQVVTLKGCSEVLTRDQGAPQVGRKALGPMPCVKPPCEKNG